MIEADHGRLKARLASVDDDQDVAAVAFSPDGRTLATAESTQKEDATVGRVRLWYVTNPHTPTLVASIDDDHEVTAVVFSPDGRSLATTAWNDGVRLWDVNDGRAPSPAMRIGPDENMTAVAFSPDSRALATTTGNSAGGNDGQFQLWDVTRLHAPTRILSVDDDQFLTAVAFSPDGRNVATGSLSLLGGGRTRLRNSTGGYLPRLVPPVDDDEGSQTDVLLTEMSAVAFSPDGHTVATASVDAGGGSYGQLQLWDRADRHELIRIAGIDDDQRLTSVAFRHDGRVLATAGRWESSESGGSRGRLRLWNMADPHAPALLAAVDDDQGVDAVTFSPDGRTLAVATDDGRTGGRLRLWDVTNPRAPTQIASLDDNQQIVAATFSSTDHILVTASRPFRSDGSAVSGGRLRLWDVVNPHAPSHLASIDDDQELTAVAFASDGRTLATATNSGNEGTDNAGGRLGLWDVTDPAAPTRTVSVDEDYSVTAVAFSPDMRALASSAGTGNGFSKLSLWDPEWAVGLSGHIHGWACGAAGRGMSPEEWARTVPGIAYRQTCP